MKEILIATEKDIPELLNVQKTAFMPVSLKINWPDAANITETLEQATEAFPHYTMLKMLNDEGRIIGMVRGKVENGSLYIGKLMVLPEYQGQGIGTQLIRAIEKQLPHQRAWLNTCEQLEGNVYLYSREGFVPFKHERINDHLTRVYMEKLQS